MRHSQADHARDREAMGFVATSSAIGSKDFRDLMVVAVELRLGRANRVSATIEWRSKSVSG